MSFTEVLIALPTHPDRIPASRMREAVRLAKVIASGTSAIVTSENFVGTTFSAFADIVMDLPSIAADLTKKSYENAQLTAAEFKELAGRDCKVIAESCNSAEVTPRLLQHARMHDLTIVPVMPPDQITQYDAETLLFESGRPVITLPLQPAERGTLDTITIAWDFSGPAARAVADALPILRLAKSVRVVTVENEKPIKASGSQEELREFLAKRGVAAVLDRYDAAGRKIGQALSDYIKQHAIDLLVMGGYGHSRLREFVLGGATASMLSKPPVPVLLSR